MVSYGVRAFAETSRIQNARHKGFDEVSVQTGFSESENVFNQGA